MLWLIALAGTVVDDAALARRLAAEPTRRILAADGGLRHLRRLGLEPELVIGDLDSLSPREAEALESSAVPVERHPVAKDYPDGELVLRRALDEGATDLLLIGAGGPERPDHWLGNLMMLAALQLERPQLEIELTDGRSRFILLAGPVSRHFAAPADPSVAPEGMVVSLIAIDPLVHGVDLEGLVWPLQDATLEARHLLAMSNRPLTADGQFRVAIREGRVLLVITPEEARPEDPSPI